MLKFQRSVNLSRKFLCRTGSVCKLPDQGTLLRQALPSSQSSTRSDYQFFIVSSLLVGVEGVTPRRLRVGVVAHPSNAAGLPNGTDVVAETRQEIVPI